MTPRCNSDHLSIVTLALPSLRHSWPGHGFLGPAFATSPHLAITYCVEKGLTKARDPEFAAKFERLQTIRVITRTTSDCNARQLAHS